jgi:hypothetical protein
MVKLYAIGDQPYAKHARALPLNLFEQPAEKVLNSLAREVLQMSQTDWAKIYAKMDKRIVVKYEQLPKGEQIGKRPQAEKQQAKSS